MKYAVHVLALAGLAAVPLSAQTERISINVDTQQKLGPMTPMWAWFGYDEPNYTYMKDGRKLLADLQAASPVPVYVRAHNLLTTGDGVPALKWGSSNAYTEDAAGNPIYDWTIVDSILDTYVKLGMKPMVQIGFMPQALSRQPEPYRHHWQPGVPSELFTGWAHPPTDYDQWRELVYQWVKHSVERFGQQEVESWWWQVWNEPDIGYWQGTYEEFLQLYDYAADGLKRALPTAKIGGPETTNPRSPSTQQWLSNFLEHVLRGTNYATGQKGSPLDYITFHAKGSPRVMPDGYVRMNVANQLRAISNGFAIVASFPEVAHLPIVIGESDPEGCAACPVSTHPANAYRNGTMYSSYTAEQLARTYQLADLHKVNLLGSVTWAFEFENQPWFYGFRDLATNGVNKPVMNTFRMLGQMAGDRVAVTSTGGLTVEAVRDSSVRGRADISALAARADRSATVLVWNYHDDDLPADPAAIELAVEGLPPGPVTLTHYRVDKEHGNSYTRWLAMGSPQPPTAAQIGDLEQASELAIIDGPKQVNAGGGRFATTFTLPRQGVSLLKLTW